MQLDRSMKQEPTEGIALSQREPVGIPVLYGVEDVKIDYVAGGVRFLKS